MVEKKVTKHHLKDGTVQIRDVAYWLSKSPEDRLAAVEFLRRQYDENPARLQRVAHITKLSQS